MKEKFSKVKAWFKENKTKILVCVGTAAVGGLAIYAVGKTVPALTIKSTTFKTEDASKFKTNFDPGLVIGEVGDAIKYKDGNVELWMDKIKLSELGQLGEDIAAKIPEANENSYVWALMNIYDSEGM